MSSWRKSGGQGGKRPDGPEPGKSGRGKPESGRPARPAPGKSDAGKPAVGQPATSGGKSSWRKKNTAEAPAGTASEERIYRRSGGFFGFLFGRKQKLWMLACLFTILLGATLYVLSQRLNRVPIVAIKVDRYSDPRIPHNQTAVRDVERLNRLGETTDDWHNEDVSNVKTVVGNQKFKSTFRDVLAKVTPGSKGWFSGKSAIIYVSAHGVVNQEGKACLLLSDSDALDETTWFPLSDLLAAIGEEPRLDGTTKLLILDCCRIRADWRLGILNNRFVDVLEDELKNAQVKKLCVLTSAGQGELAWSAPELGGGTVFGYFLAEGLRRGAVDENHSAKTAGFAGFSKDTFSIEALEKYVRKADNWVAATRSTNQHPRLIVRPKEGELKKSDLGWISPTSSQGRPSNDPAAGLEDLKKTLNSYWELHERLQKDERFSLLSPVGWAEFELYLLRLEELYLDRVDPKDAVEAAKNVEKAKNALRVDFSRNVFLGSFPFAQLAHSFADPTVASADMPVESQIAIREAIIKKWDDARRPDPATFGAVGPLTGDSERGDPARGTPPPVSPVPAVPVPGLDYELWNWLSRQTEVSRSQLADARSCLEKTTADADVPGKIETCFLKMLDRHLDDAESPQFNQSISRAISRAIQTRKRAEELGAPADPRVLNWIRPLLEKADRQRRAAEDLLFVGSPESLTEADGIWKKLLDPDPAAGAYNAVQARKLAVELAYRQRDRIWSRLPWLARWLDTEGALFAPNLQTLAEHDKWDQLLKAIDALGEKLDDAETGDLSSLTETGTQADQLFENLRAEANKLQENSQRGSDELVTICKTGACRRARGFLVDPLATVVERKKLRERYDAVIRALSKPEAFTSILKLPTATAETSTDAENEPVFQALDVVTRILAMEIVSSSNDETSPQKTRFEKTKLTEPVIRQALARTIEEIRKSSQAIPAATDIRDTALSGAAQEIQFFKDILARRQGISRADLLARRRAWFGPCVDAVVKATDKIWRSPSRRLMQFDLAILGLWHGDRALDDFWGPVPGSPDSHFYFSLAAKGFSDALAAIDLVKVDTFLSERKTRLEDKLDAREKSAGLIAQAIRKKVVFQADATLDSDEKQTVKLKLPEAKDRPAGFAAVYLERAIRGADSGDRDWYTAGDEKSHRQRVAIDPKSEPPPAEFAIRRKVIPAAGRRAELKAVAVYRGHSSAADAAATFLTQSREIRAIEPIDVELAPPQVLVRGNRNSVTELLFIVDASGSMKDGVNNRETRDISQQKWTLAKNAVQSVVRELSLAQDHWAANGEEWRAGLMMYAHRATWKGTGSGIQDVRYNSQASPEAVEKWKAALVFPYNDVETLVKMGKFDAELVGKINAAFDGAAPFGVTPLYFALTKAIDEFTPNGATINRNIILVTDGVDNPQLPPNLANTRTLPGDVEAALTKFKQRTGSPIGLDLVYFGQVENEDKPALKAMQDFIRRANDLSDPRRADRDENMHMAQNPESLYNDLRKAVERNRLKFLVVRSGSTPAELKLANSSWIAAGADYQAITAAPSAFSIQVEGIKEASQEVRLEGGESLSLTFRQNKLEFDRFKPAKGSPKPRNVAAGKNRLNVYPYNPELSDGGATFKFALQYHDPAKYTPRPSDVWAEITPIDDRQGDNPIVDDDSAVFFDKSFVTDQQVPVLQFRFPRWPATAGSARVKLWLAFPDARGRSPILPNLNKSCSQALKESRLPDDWLKFPDFPAAFRVTEKLLGDGVTQITVSERQLEDAPVDWCRVGLSRPPDHLVRKYSLGERRADHVFEMRQETADLEILITPGSALKQQALAQVPAPDDDWVIPIRSAGQPQATE